MTSASDLMTYENAAAMGLSHDEWDLINTRLGRKPNLCELGIFSAMWSEHCSYKSSKKWLKTLPIDGPQVIEGPGENAGAVEIGDGLAAIFKIESHNHPSFIEPYQGAATGVGGILRDVFTMGARPVALLNALRFGAADHDKTRHLVGGVVSGIGGYGNCIGIPPSAARLISISPTMAIFWSMRWRLVSPIVTAFFGLLRLGQAIRLSMLGQRPVVMAFTARLWRQRNFPMKPRASVQLSKWVIHLQANCFLKLALN